MTTKAKAKAAASKPTPAPLIALTTAPGQAGPFGYVAGLLLTDVPPEALKSHRLWMTADADAVAAARASGADTLPYRG